jgi:hypothetical protein
MTAGLGNAKALPIRGGAFASPRRPVLRSLVRQACLDCRESTRERLRRQASDQRPRTRWNAKGPGDPIAGAFFVGVITWPRDPAEL